MEIEKAYGLGGNKQLSCKITVAQLSRKEQGKHILADEEKGNLETPKFM